MSRYNAYSDYQDSALAWMGKVPKHWNKIKFKWILEEKKKKSNPTLPAGSISFGKVVYKSEENLSLDTKSSYQEVLSGEFLINPLNLNFDLKSLRTALSSIDVVVSTGYIVLNSSGHYNKKYLRWLLQEFDVAHMKTLGSGVRQTINYTDIANCLFFYPPSNEQVQIANFLDHETAKIDTLIEKQQQLIKLLKEKRQAVLSHAVTKGLNPDAPMKDSGVEWLGEVPEHWDVAALRRLISLMEQGKSPECENTPASLNQWGVLKTSCVNNGIFNPNENKALPEHIPPHTKYEVQAGDVLMSRASGSIKLIGSVAMVPSDVRGRVLLSDKVFRIFLGCKLDAAYFTYLMSTPYMRTLVERAISGAEGMANNITKSSIMEFFSPIPPIDEQVDIVSYLKSRCELFDGLISKAEHGSTLLGERRTALISAAVTGKIDVRGWQPKNNNKENLEVLA